MFARNIDHGQRHGLFQMERYDVPTTIEGVSVNGFVASFVQLDLIYQLVHIETEIESLPIKIQDRQYEYLVACVYKSLYT